MLERKVVLTEEMSLPEGGSVGDSQTDLYGLEQERWVPAGVLRTNGEMHTGRWT